MPKESLHYKTFRKMGLGWTRRNKGKKTREEVLGAPNGNTQKSGMAKGKQVDLLSATSWDRDLSS